MAIQAVDAYLSFDGTADQALALYERALGAKVETLVRYGDLKEFASATEHAGRVMHAVVKLGAGRLMLNDAPPGTTLPKESNVRIALDLDDPADAAARFDALAVGGRILFPLHDTSFGAKLGILEDAFGISWAFHCDPKKR